jgi:cytoskeletal protein CcmA (bactofilin family)
MSETLKRRLIDQIGDTPTFLAEGSRLTGDLETGGPLVVCGRITGRLVVEGKLEVGASAVLRADIVARSIAVAKGAVIDGAVTVTSGEPVVRFEEKRQGQDG